MANRQHGRPRSPAGGRSIRAVPVSRSPSRETAPPGTPIYTEPEVRRWPHPIEGAAPSARQTAPAGQTDTALYYIHCALSYQNQLLADIKSLLEQLAADSAPAAGGDPPGGT